MIRSRQFTLCVFALITIPVPAAAQITGNPIMGSAPIAPWSLVLEDVVQVPSTVDGIARPEYLTGNRTTGLNYVIDQHGPIYSFDPAAANPMPTLFLDADSALGNLHDQAESGVRSLAFHPDFDVDGTAGFRKMYTTISRTGSASAVGNPVVFDSPGSTDHYTTVGEWTLNANGTVDLGSYRELMRIEQPFSNHNAGHIGFNPTAVAGGPDYGNLYIAVGDGGSGGGPFDLSQDIDVSPAPYPHGKILRIDPIASDTDPYTVPIGNPFVGQGNRLQEVWAYGLRNPHKFAWDPVTGEMYISDIGQGTVEEINVGRAEANYGWNEREGAFVYVNGSSVSPLPPGHANDAFTYPVAQYDHDGTNGTTTAGTAIVGGPVYRGDDVPELTGMYLFADFSRNPGPIFAVHVDDLVERDDFMDITNLDDGRLAPFVEVKIRDDGLDKDFRQFLRDANNSNYSRTDTRWGVGSDGEIYIMSKRDGMVRRIAGIVRHADFNTDGLLNCLDVDDLVMEIVAGTNSPLFDLTRDGVVDAADLDEWLVQGGAVNLPAGNPYLAGDANLDGVVDGSDFVVWNANKFTATAAWCDADFNADGVVDGSDFLVWNAHKFMTSPSPSAVPEPGTGVLACVALVLLGTGWRRR